MRRIMKRLAPASSRGRKRRTTISLSGDDLAALGRLLSAGQVMLQLRHPVLGRVKAAMTRLGLPSPRGM